MPMGRPDDRKDMIEFLVRRKFPPLTLATLPASSRVKGTTTMGRFLRHEEMNRFREELENLHPKNLNPYTKSSRRSLLKRCGARSSCDSSISLTLQPTLITGAKPNTGLLKRRWHSPWARRPRSSVGPRLIVTSKFRHSFRDTGVCAIWRIELYLGRSSLIPFSQQFF